MIASERLYLTADKKAVVAAGDTRAAFLYATPGDEIPDSAVALFGLVDGGLGKGSKSSVTKAPEEKAGASSDDLTVLKGIGKATAKALVAAGVDSFAALASVDPTAPPAVISGAGEADWSSWAEGAKAELAKADKEKGAAEDKEARQHENKGG